jgi:glucose/arabinose dehydrogenase
LEREAKSLAQSLIWAVLAFAAQVAGAAGFETVRIAAGLDRPVYLTAPPDDRRRLFIVEQHTGDILILDRATLTIHDTPFLNVPGLATGNEQGLLGLAFHPQYADNGYLYVNFTAGGFTHVRRYRVSSDPDRADPDSGAPVLGFVQPQNNHNGGWLGFGPDGFLYVATGDGGFSNDTGTGHTEGTGNSQDVSDNLLGKILRLDVDGDDLPEDPDRNYAIPPSNPFAGTAGDDEIWAYGLRNPWRASFDRLTGDLYIGDVGQGAREEIDVHPAASPAGSNYGWRLREGTIATPSGGVGGARPPGAIDPIYDYPHGSGPREGFSVTGGYVYRGPIEALRGLYFFGDYVSGRIWSLRFDGSDPAAFDGANYSEFTDWSDLLVPDAGSIDQIASFGEDPEGNLYIVGHDGEIFMLRALPGPSRVLPAVLPLLLD